MENIKQHHPLASTLRAAIAALEMAPDSQLYQDAISLCDRLENPVFRIAVFAPFNYGKSTLLNALLGKKTLPIDLIPTTGAAIRVRYGETLASRITLKNGEIIARSDTNLLKEYALLDGERRMRDDVAEVEVFCPHSFLKMGVELVDLPGTDDREEQEKLVKDWLFTSDLILQVLDARKLMTLAEREQLRDWLLDRGIESVIFVVNFLNLLEPEEQKSVQNRLLFVAESFASKLPAGISNLYRVDALPALRARLKGDVASFQETGLETLETALQRIVTLQSEQSAMMIPRTSAIGQQVQSQLQEKISTLTAEIEEIKLQHHRLEIKQKAAKIIKQGLEKSIAEFQSWLTLSCLRSNYQDSLTNALEKDTFTPWEKDFKEAASRYKKLIEEWVEKGSDFFEYDRAEELIIPFPDSLESSADDSTTDDRETFSSETDPDVIDRLSDIFQKTFQTAKSNQSEEKIQQYREQFRKICVEMAEEYLTEFSEAALSVVNQYQENVESIIHHSLAAQLPEKTQRDRKLQTLKEILANLEPEINY